MSDNDFIEVKGAKTHNLKNLDIKIPRNKLVVITGLSGSGKSSLAFDTIFAEGQRRYIESLNSYVRQFLGMMDKPDVEHISGLSPAISIDQKATSKNPRSTVGTITEIYDFLRLLCARIGKPHCVVCGKKVEKQSVAQITDMICNMEEGKKVMILSPVVRGKKGSHKSIIENIKKEGFVRMYINDEMYSISDEIKLDPEKKHTIEIVIDRLVVKDLQQKYDTLSNGEKVEAKNDNMARIADSVEIAMKKSSGIATVMDFETKEKTTFSELFICPDHGPVIEELEPRNFSFNSPYGACEECHGLGTKMIVKEELVLPNLDLSINEGAIIPWNITAHNEESWNKRILKQVAKDYKIDFNKPIADLSKTQINILLYGTGDKEYSVDMKSNKFEGNVSVKFEGVIPNLERRFRETESEFSRKQIEKFMTKEKCDACNGHKLKKEILGVKVAGKNIIEISDMSIENALSFFKQLPEKISKTDNIIAKNVITEILERLKFLDHVGLSYLTLSRNANTLSGGEAQRIRLATQIGSKLQGVLYVLDEPSIGLHQKDNDKLIQTLRELQEVGNTVIVVEHDEDTMREADWLIEIGPRAGLHGGKLQAEGEYKNFIKNENSSTAKYLTGKSCIEYKKIKRRGNGKYIDIINAQENNLQGISVTFQLNQLIGVTGVSGSGKSSLINKILAPFLQNKLNKAKKTVGKVEAIRGIENLDKVIVIDQSPIGRTPRSNPATYTGIFTEIRDLFASTTEAKMRGYKSGRFSFNVKGGRCEACQGDGIVKIDMNFLSDVYVTCDTCKGKRYNREALEITWKGKNISDVLSMTIEESLGFFKSIPNVYRKLEILNRVGLGYISLGQSAVTLSGGEAQRIKLATELSKKSTGKTFYILDEPTTGLHFEDIKKLLAVLDELVDSGNTVLVIEHNLDVVKNCDYIVDIGPDGGIGGGQVVGQGLPEEIIKIKNSHTGKFLKKTIEKHLS